MNEVQIMTAARTAYEVVRRYKEFYAEPTDGGWDELEETVRHKHIVAIQEILKRKSITPETVHQLWIESMAKLGWKYGPAKSDIDKTHPCLIDYNELDDRDKVKDVIFLAAIRGVLAI